METYSCIECGYLYEPTKGDPDNGVNPGTSYNDIPASWVCPVCGAGKADFTPAS